MKYKLTHLALALFCATALRAHAAEPVYQLRFDAGELKNTGSAGGEAQLAGILSLVDVVIDADLGIYAANLKMSANGSQGGALAFPESGSRLQLGGLSDELTLAMWVKWRGPHAHADKRHGLVSTMPAKKDAGWAFSILEDGRLQFNWVNEKGGSFRTSSASLAENQWTHVAMRWQGGEKSGGLEFFINGEPVGVNQKWTGGGPIKKSGLNLILGVMDEAAYLPLNGSLAEVNIFGSALSNENIRALAQAPRQSALPQEPARNVAKAVRPPRMVFAHYMVALPTAGGDASVEDYKKEIEQAQALGIDGFALNSGGWTIEKKIPSYKERTSRIYEAAKQLGTGFKLFISADFATKLNFPEFTDMVLSFRDHPNQLKVDGKPVISSYKGENIDLTRNARTAFTDENAIFLIPFLRSNPQVELPSQELVEGVFRANQDLDGFFDFGAAGSPQDLCAATKRMAGVWMGAGKVFMAPVTPYYRGRGKNFRMFESRGFEGMAMQWENAINLGVDWVEIVTWNDWAESSYIAQFGTPADTHFWDDHYGKMLSHRGFAEASKHYIKWFKDAKEPAITEDRFFYFYRVHPKTTPAPDGRFPRGVENAEDRIYATVFLKAPAVFTIECGDVSARFPLEAGVHHVSSEFAQGTPRFQVIRDDQVVLAKTAEMPISGDSSWGNFNYFSSSNL